MYAPTALLREEVSGDVYLGSQHNLARQAAKGHASRPEV